MKPRKSATVGPVLRVACTLALACAFGPATDLLLAQDTSAAKEAPTAVIRRHATDAESKKPTVRNLDAATAGNQPQSEQTPAAGSPKITIDQPIHDFGDVWTVPALNHSFIVRNTGTDVLRITKVKPGCGCTVSGAYDREIPPGGTGKIPLTLRTHGKTNFSTNINISSNDPASPDVRVTLKGNIKYYVEANPRNVRFNRIGSDETVRQNVVITTTSDQARLELVADGVSGNFKGTLTPTDDPRQYQLTVEGTPPFKEGSTSGFIKINTGISEQPELQIPIAAYVAPRIEVRPAQVYLPTAVTQPTPRIVMFKNNGTEPVEVLSASVTNPAVSAEVREVAKGRDYQITLQLPANYLPPAAGDKLILKLLDGTEKEHVIPIISRPVQTADQKPRTPPRRPAMDLVGKPAPPVTLAMHDGKKIELPGKDQVTVLEFYTSWCGFCKKSMPSVEKVYQQFKDNPNVRIIAVSQDTRGNTPRDRTEQQVVDTFFKERGLTFGLALDPTKTAGNLYKATSYPTMFVLGKTGNVEAVHVGAAADLSDVLKKNIETLLDGKTLVSADESAESESAGS